MKNSKLALFFFILFSTGMQIVAQPSIDDGKAHRRYWYYRTRMINDFMKIGKNQSECIAFAERNQGINDATAKIGPDQIDLTNMYLLTLALEYKLLTRNNQSTSETIKEIYHLMYTINRLDLEADNVWSNYANNGNALSATNDAISPVGGTMNGYIMREDFQANYIRDNITHFNYALQEAGYNPALPANTPFNVSNLPTISGNEYSYTGLPLLTNEDGGGKFRIHASNPTGLTNVGTTQSPVSAANVYEVSLVHDKFYSMLAAFMFVVKYIPGSTYYYENGVPQSFQDGSSGIKEQAVAITNRITSYLKGQVFTNNIVPDWIGKQPDGTNLPLFSNGFMTPYSFPVHRTICSINNGYPWQYTDNCFSYSDVTAGTVGWASYDLMSNLQPVLINNVLIPNGDAAAFLAWNHACTNYPVNIPGTTIPVPCYAIMALNTAGNDLQWAELMRKVLFQSGMVLASNSKFSGPISTAPCLGPYNFSGGVFPDLEWSSQDRTEHPSAKGSTSPFEGRYPGVDYMMLHNLYYEYINQLDDAGSSQSSTYKNAYNLMDNYDNWVWPNTIPLIGTRGIVGSRMNVKVFQNLQSRAQIYATASPLAVSNTIPSDVEYRAGKEIALLPEDGLTPGFKIEEGSEFHAYIQRYLCSNSDYGNGLRVAQGQTNNDYESDEMNTEIPIHIVSHPPSDSDRYPLGPENIDPSKDQIEVQTQRELTLQNAAMQKIMVSTSNHSWSFELMPNPTTGVFNLSVIKSNDDEVFSLNIIDMKGITILSETNINSGKYNFSSYPKGIYMVNVTSNMGYSESKKLCITE